MIRDFSYFEQGIERVSRQLPGMPQDRVLLNRLFFFVFNELNDSFNTRLAEFGLTSASFLALAMLMGSEENRLNPCDLSHALVSSRTNVTRLADELVAAGWVARNPSQEDRRRVDLTLTPAGRALVISVLPKFWKLVEKQWADFSREEIVEFDRLLRKMLSGLTRSEEDA